VEDVRIGAVKNRREWMVDLHERRVDFAHNPTYLRILEALAPQGVEQLSIQPTPYPPWLRDWMITR
jgi:hypothetical protein